MRGAVPPLQVAIVQGYIEHLRVVDVQLNGIVVLNATNINKSVNGVVEINIT